MENDFKALIEKYKADLMQYHAANPNGGEQERYVAPTATGPIPPAPPKTEPPAPVTPEPLDLPGAPEAPDTPIIPPAPQNIPEMPVILPGEPPISPVPRVLEAESPENFANDDIADNDLDDDEGYLQIRAVTAEGALPLSGALAIISKSESGELVAQVLTDQDGLTAAVPLRTVSRELSEVEGNQKPYDTYSIEITLDGYYGVKSEHVPVFGGITNLQTVSLIPLAEFAKQGEEYTVDNPDYNL